MQSITRRHSRARLAANALLCITGLASLTLAPAVRAQDAHTGNSISPALRYAGGLLSVGGYYFTGSGPPAPSVRPSSTATPNCSCAQKPGRGNADGGLEIMSANDHLLPFQGGNEYQLIGPAGRVSIPRVVGRIRPFATGGLFYGRLRSVTAGFRPLRFRAKSQRGRGVSLCALRDPVYQLPR